MTGLIPEGTATLAARPFIPEPERELPQDPVAWVRDDLSEHPWSKQRQIMRSVVEHRYTAVPSCHGSGKSYIASRIAAWWIAAHAIGEAFVVTSAPTEPQVKAILWRELARAHRNAALPGRITLDAHWYVGPKGAEELIAFGRKPADYTDRERAMQAFQGIHARYVLVLLDEATGVPGWLFDAADTLVTNEASRVLAIGNPDDPTSHFETICRPGSGWNTIPISAFDTPNLTGEPVPEYLRELLVSKQWVEERKARWGEDSALYQSKVLGRFPDTSDDSVITPALVKAAQMRDLPGTERGNYGLDVARFGKDSTQLYRSRGGVVRLVAEWRKCDTVETANRTMGARVEEVPIVIDADGIGGGVYDQLRSRGEWVIPFTAQDAIRNPRRFANRRSEIWWTYREIMEDGLVDLDPDDDDLAAQLQMPKWGYDGRGRIRVETKEEMQRRGLPSPDKADAAIMAELGGPPVGVLPPGSFATYPANGRPKMETAGLRRRPM